MPFRREAERELDQLDGQPEARGDHQRGPEAGADEAEVAGAQPAEPEQQAAAHDQEEGQVAEQGAVDEPAGRGGDGFEQVGGKEQDDERGQQVVEGEEEHEDAAADEGEMGEERFCMGHYLLVPRPAGSARAGAHRVWGAFPAGPGGMAGAPRRAAASRVSLPQRADRAGRLMVTVG